MQKLYLKLFLLQQRKLQYKILLVSQDLSRAYNKFLLEKSKIIDKKMLSQDDDNDNCEKNYCEKSDYKRQRSDNNNSRDRE